MAPQCSKIMSGGSSWPHPYWIDHLFCATICISCCGWQAISFKTSLLAGTETPPATHPNRKYADNTDTCMQVNAFKWDLSASWDFQVGNISGGCFSKTTDAWNQQSFSLYPSQYCKHADSAGIACAIGVHSSLGECLLSVLLFSKSRFIQNTQRSMESCSIYYPREAVTQAFPAKQYKSVQLYSSAVSLIAAYFPKSLNPESDLVRCSRRSRAVQILARKRPNQVKNRSKSV